MFFSISIFSQVEMKYNEKSKNLPKWVQLMYMQSTDEGLVIEEYNKFYKNNKFIKNKHTQYYKRWIRSLSRTTNLNTLRLHNYVSMISNMHTHDEYYIRSTIEE